jgi:quercetin dioxygenase-like cupin family protein
MRYPRFHTVRLLALFVAAEAGLFAQAPQTPLENDQVRVIQVTDQPHAKTSPHEHKLNRVMIYLTPGRQEITPQGGKTAVLQFKAGDVKWSPASGMHVSEVTSSAPVGIVEVEIKKEGDPGKTAQTALDPLKVDPKDYKLEFENSQVRVVRVKFGPHHAVPLHEHLLNRVVIYLTDQNGRMTTPDGKVDTAQHKAGEVSWGSPAKHKEENLNDKAFEAVVVELKN